MHVCVSPLYIVLDRAVCSSVSDSTLLSSMSRVIDLPPAAEGEDGRSTPSTSVKGEGRRTEGTTPSTVPNRRCGW